MKTTVLLAPIVIVVLLILIISLIFCPSPVVGATKFTITVTQSANGAISPNTKDVDQGNNQTFTITPNTGYSIATLIVDGSSVPVASSCTFSNVQAAHSITATFAINNYTLTVVQGADGVISPGTTNVNYGASQTFTITPNTGYSIASLTVDGSSVTIAASYTFSNINTNHTITATFTVSALTITVTQNSKGVISPGTTNVNYGASQTFTITPNVGYSITSLIVDGSTIQADSTYTFSNITTAHFISATFANKFDITVVQGADGVISPGTTNVNYGASQTFTITPNTGYSIASLTVDGSSTAPASTYTFSNVTAAHSISATFTNTFTVTVIQSTNGQISPGTLIANYDSNTIFTISASNGYHITDVVVDGISQGAIALYTFTNIQTAHNITASFGINQYIITVTVGVYGSSNLASQTVNWGTSLNFVLTPNPGYHVSDVKINGTSIGMPESFATNITGNTSVDVNFAANTCSFTINSGTHGSVNPGNQTVNWGTSLILTVTPEVGYHVSDIIVNGSSFGALTSYSFTATGPTTIAATFAIDTFIITVIQGDNGFISPSTTNANYGDSQTFTITPSNGYSLSSLVIDGSQVAVASSYTFSNVQAAHSITAIFALISTSPTPTPSSSQTSTATPNQTSQPTPTPSSSPSPSPSTNTLTSTPTPTKTTLSESTNLGFLSWPLLLLVIPFGALASGIVAIKRRKKKQDPKSPTIQLPESNKPKDPEESIDHLFNKTEESIDNLFNKILETEEHKIENENIPDYEKSELLKKKYVKVARARQILEE